jgi:ribonuclease HII
MVDRQGGRRYYGTWLAELMPGAPLRIIEEVPARSAYSAGRTSVEFRVGADGLFFETALASMIAKYVREIAMGLFNSWWHHRLPGIRPTAGYPADAKRFIADVESAGMMIDDRAMLIRRL